MLKFSKNSWHYRLADIGGTPAWAHGFCDYARMVFKGLMLFIIATALVGFLVIENLIGIVALFQGTWMIAGETPLFAAAVNVFTLAVIAIVGIAASIVELKERSDAKKYAARYDENGDRIYDNTPPKQPGFIRTWWNSVHDKICPVVEFTD
jgi:hypothetical protein